MAVHNELLSRALAAVVEELRGGGEAAWSKAERALRLAYPDDNEIEDSEAALAVECRDVEELSRLGSRRPPVLGFLPRENPVNVFLGRMRPQT